MALPQSWLDVIRGIERRIGVLENRSPFANTGVHPNGQQGIDSDNFVHGVSGFSLNGGTGKAEFKDITLYDLPNSMLASPVTGSSAHASADSFALATGSNVPKATATVTVPAGFSRALVQAFSAISAYNPTASSDLLYVGCRINNVAGVDQNAGWSMSQQVPAATQGAVAESSTALITGLSAGQTFTVQTTASTGSAAWSSTSSNVVNIDATVLWLR